MKKFIAMCFGLSLILLISFSNMGIAQQGTQVGVSVGETFNYKITDDSLLSDSSPLSQFSLSELLSGYNDFNLTEIESHINYSIDELELDTSMVPKKGDIIKVKVVELPSDTNNGTISVTFGNETKDIESWFMFGTPVTTTNWTFWESMINKIETINDNVTDITLSTSLAQNTNTFNLSVTVYLNNAPDVLTSYGISNLQLDVKVNYNKETGVQQSMEMKLSLKAEISGFPTTYPKFIYSWELTDDEPNVNKGESSAETSEPETAPGFELVALLAGVTILIPIYKRKRK